MEYNEKALRKAIRGIVKEYKDSMFGRYTCTDLSGKKWKIEYNVLYWKEDWKDWDSYSYGNAQKHIFEDVPDALIQYPADKIIVTIDLVTENSFNAQRSVQFNLDGTRYENPKYKI